MGYSYDFTFGLFINNGTIVIENPSDFPIVIGDFQKEQSYIYLALTKLIFLSTRQTFD